MHPAPSFELFGTAHLATLLAIVAISLLLPLAVRGLAPGAARPVALGLAGVLVGTEWLQVGMRWAAGVPWEALLPLHLCGMAIYLTAWTLIAPPSPLTRRIYEVVYFWGLAGATQALLTPDLDLGFPHPAYLAFFLGHGAIVTGVLYGALVLRMRPHGDSIPRVALVTLGYAAAVFPINLLLGTNYLYLMAKSGQSSLLDWLGPWPWYLAPLAVVALAFLFVWYLPFYLRDLWRRRQDRRDRAARTG